MPEAKRHRRILLLSPFPPRPHATHGGAGVIGRLVQELAERTELGVLYLRAPGEPGLGAGLGERLALAVEVRRPDRQSSAGRRLAGLAHGAAGLLTGRPAWASDWRVPAFGARARDLVAGWRPDVVQAEFHVMGQYLHALGRPAPALVLVPHEAGAAAAADRAMVERGLRRCARRVDAQAWRRYERDIAGRADAVVAFTERDRAALAELAPAARIEVMPFGVDVPEEALDPVGAEPPRILFVGNLNHPPNVQAALDLAHRIVPAVRRGRPSATLEIVGAGPPAVLRRLAGPGVVATGVVPDVRPHLDRAAVVAVPARVGGGMRVKVVEALAAGKAVVATARALEGVALTPGEHALVAGTDAEFAEAIAGLLDAPERRRELGRAGREWARKHLRWEDVADAYEALYADLLAVRRTGARGVVPC